MITGTIKSQVDRILRQHDASHRQHEHGAARHRESGHPLSRFARAGSRRRGSKTKKTELLFLALFLRLLKPGGRAAVIVPEGVLFGSSDAILLFTKTNSGGTDHVWFYDVDADGWSLDDKRTPLLPYEKLGPARREALTPEEHAKNNLPERHYQIRAIRRIGEAFERSRESGRIVAPWRSTELRKRGGRWVRSKRLASSSSPGSSVGTPNRARGAATSPRDRARRDLSVREGREADRDT